MPSVPKRRERKMLEENWLLPLLERPKRKMIAKHSEPNTLEIVNKEPRKLESSDKSKKFWPPSWKELQDT